MKSLPGASTYTSTATQMNPEAYSRRSALCQGENSPANHERFFIFSHFASAGEYSIPGGFDPTRQTQNHQMPSRKNFPMFSLFIQRSFP
jgi:hypothetical protein